MATIKEDYVSFEVAKMLKDKGFDGDTSSCYILEDGTHHIMSDKVVQSEYYESQDSNEHGHLIQAPTHQMAMKWLREMHKIQICVEQNPYDAWHYWGFSMSYIDEKINELPNPTQAFIHICPTKIPNNCYKTYEEAVEAALKYTLENLI